MRENEINTIGVILSSFIEQNNIIAKKVCDGLCSFSTMSRIVRNERIADSLLSEALLQRIGKNVTQFELILDHNDYELWKERMEIKNAYLTNQYDVVRQKAAAYIEKTRKEHFLHEQFGLYYEMLVEDDREQVKKMCKTILKISKTDYELERKQFYTEIEIMTLLKLSQFEVWDKQEESLLDMLEFVENRWEQRKKEDIGVEIILQLISDCDYEIKKRMAYIDKAIDFISHGRGIQKLDLLYFYKVKLLYENSKEKRDIALLNTIKEYCLMAYSVADVLENLELLEEIKNFAMEELAWQITKLEM